MKRPTLKDILNLTYDDINKLKSSELSRIVNEANAIANKRIRRFYGSLENNIVSPAIRAVGETLGVDVDTGEIPIFKVPKATKNINRINQLRASLSNVREFLTNKTSTFKGFNEYRSKVKELIPATAFDNLDNEREFWRGYSRFEKSGKFTTYDSTQVLTWIKNEIDNGVGAIDADTIYQMLIDEGARNDIEEFEKYSIDINGISFDVEDIDDDPFGR